MNNTKMCWLAYCKDYDFAKFDGILTETNNVKSDLNWQDNDSSYHSMLEWLLLNWTGGSHKTQEEC